MDIYQSLSGALEISITCAHPAGVMTQLEEAGIVLRNVRIEEELVLQAQINRSQEKALRKLCDKKGYSFAVQGYTGIYWRLRAFWHRPVLLLGVLIMVLLGMYVPSRVFFVRVEGNVTVPGRLIVETAADCGIRFGANRRQVRSEKMKNALLEAMPQLQWAGVNTSGCVAIITVRERQEPAMENKNDNVGSIVAARDGVITAITATKGSQICKVGQAVKAGEILISGYTDCGIALRAERAEGEVYAQTDREITAIFPSERLARGEIVASETKYSLIIGKKRINFYFTSGISGSTCVKMYEENYMTLPGGFQLPVLLIKETLVKYETGTTKRKPEEDKLAQFCRDYLQSHMIAGQILAERVSVTQEDAVIITGQYACREMIGQFRKEEVVRPNGTND